MDETTNDNHDGWETVALGIRINRNLWHVNIETRDRWYQGPDGKRTIFTKVSAYHEEPADVVE